MYVWEDNKKRESSKITCEKRAEEVETITQKVNRTNKKHQRQNSL
jgi:hypothetical protein